MEAEDSEVPSPLPKPFVNKHPVLSHTVSLPITSSEHSGAAAAATSSKKRPVEAAASGTGTGTGAPPRSPAASAAGGKSWSFGNMAKAVGCGVTAFGTGVVSSSIAVAQATGSGVLTGSKAVGEGVFQGTKAAGRVTMAAGKGVIQAGETVGSGVVSGVEIVGSGVVSGVSAIGTTTVQAGKAMQDMMERSEQLLEDGTLHVVLPDETMQDICAAYNILPIHLIKANGLTTRKLRVGKELLIPAHDDLMQVTRMKHEHDMLQVNAAKVDGGGGGGGTEDGTLTFTYESVFFSSPAVFQEFRICDIEKIVFSESCQLLCESLPDLLRPDMVLVCEKEGDDEEEEEKEKEERSATHFWLSIVVVGGQDDCRQHQFRLCLQTVHQVLDNCDLWQPEHVKLETEIHRVISDLPPPDDSSFSVSMTAESSILSDKLVQNLHRMLPSSSHIKSWNRVFSSEQDGFSLQNFFRVTGEEEEPFLLVVSDHTGDIFGAYLTCRPTVTDRFVGTGRSWLFFADSRSSVAKVYRWSGKNDYFFQGQLSGITIGAHDGKFGIFIDGDMNNGCVQKCETFVAWPDREKNFAVKHFECWNFV